MGTSKERLIINAEIPQPTKTKQKQPEEMSLQELEAFVQRRREQTRKTCQRWRKNNMEHVRQYMKEYRMKHPEKFRQDTPEAREYRRKWREKNKDHVNAYRRQWEKDRRERIRKALELRRTEAMQKGGEQK